MKKLMILLGVLFSLGCAELPEKPPVFICTYRAVDSLFMCTSVASGEEKEVQANKAQGYVSFSPSDWLLVDSYIKELGKQARQKCK